MRKFSQRISSPAASASAGLDVARRAQLAGVVATTISRSPFERPRTWPSAVVVIRGAERRVTSRGDFAHWLAANDLRDQARECTLRRVPWGCILLWLEVDDSTAAGVGFDVFDLAAALRAATAGA